MCHFVTAVLPKDVDLDEIATALDLHAFGFRVIDNPHVRAQLG